MVAINIRNVPDETRDDLAARAAASGRSLQEYLRTELIELARRPERRDAQHTAGRLDDLIVRPRRHPMSFDDLKPVTRPESTSDVLRELGGDR